MRCEKEQYDIDKQLTETKKIICYNCLRISVPKGLKLKNMKELMIVTTISIIIVSANGTIF